MTEFYNEVRDRLIRYAKIDTQSVRNCKDVPTSKKQFDLAHLLLRELEALKLSDIYLDNEKCVLYAEIPANVKTKKDLGIIAHMDTSPDAPGENCQPWVLNNYDGGDIVLNKEKNIVMTTSRFPNLLKYIGQDLILTDGQTLLGGDDKAAISVMMSLAKYLVEHDEIKHGRIVFAFTPDEEVGGLARDLDLDRFNCEAAYTIDGDYVGYYIDQTFNASAAHIEIDGLSVHTGTAKGKMINASEIAAEFINLIPAFERPQYTDGVEGFYHITSINGSCEKATVDLIIRDFDINQFEQREDYIRKCVDYLKDKYDSKRIRLKINETYRSMKMETDKFPYMVESLIKAIRMAGLEPKSIPFRGGTDGSALSHRGLPCPNLSAGYENAHGLYEFVPIQSMEKNVEILLNLIKIFVEM